MLNFLSDPWDNDTVPETMRCKSGGYGGDYNDIIVPSGANFPAVNPTRYQIDLPVIPSLLESYTFYDVSSSTALTPVQTTPAANQYRIAPADSKTPARIEFHSGQAGHVVKWDVYAIGSVVLPEYVVPTGTIMINGSSEVPDGFLYCDGSALLRTEYKSLFDAIGTAFGASDANHFNVPDLRGQFLRGQDDGEGLDPDAATRSAIKTGGATADNIGSKQASALANHGHSFLGSQGGSGGMQNYLNVSGLICYGPNDWTTAPGAWVSVEGNSTENRPTNVNVRFIIKY